MSEALFSDLPTQSILAALEKSPGNEVGSGKLDNPESSAALAVNTFGFFLHRPGDLPPLPGTEQFGWPAEHVGVEQCVRFPWRGGRHPWLDAFLETATHIIGIECKRFEPFRARQAGTLAEAYWRPVWGDRMRAFETMRDGLGSGQVAFARLDAVQLVKHAFGLRTEAERRGKPAVLLYLYAAPACWPGGKPLDQTARAIHLAEINRFARDVHGDEVAFRACSYRELLTRFKASARGDVRDHAFRVQETYAP